MASKSADLQLRGKVVIVTGAARGIGEAIARAFGSAQCSVVIADRMRRAEATKELNRLQNK